MTDLRGRIRRATTRGLGVRRRLVGAGAILAVLIVAPATAAAAGFTWRTNPSGPNPSTGRYEWSSATNWTNGAPGSGSQGTFTFPSQSNACNTQQFCDNDLSGLTMTGLTIDTGAGYVFTGHPITLDGPLTASASGLRDPLQAFVEIPISLDGDQQWTVAGSPDGPGGADVPSGLTFEQPLTGTGTLGVTLATAGQLVLGADDELGPLTVSGDPSRSGADADANGTVQLNDALNASSGAPVTIDHTGLIAREPDSSAVAQSGPLHLLGGDLQIGNDDASGLSSGLTVNGAFSADASSQTTFMVDANSEQADGDYAQLTATGPVTLAGGLDLRFGIESAVSCDPPEPGMRYTLITAPAGLQGTFDGLPSGSVVPVHGICPDGGIERSAPVRLDYTADSLMGSVVGTATVATTVSPNPSAQGQSVTLNAAVAASYGQSSGTVDFTGSNGAVISGCSGVPTQVGFNGQSTAQCSTTALVDGEPVVADYHPDLHSFSPPAHSTPVIASVSGSPADAGPQSAAPAPASIVGPAATASNVAGPAVSASNPAGSPASPVVQPRFTIGTATTRSNSASVPLACAAGGPVCVITLRLTVSGRWRHGRLVTTTGRQTRGRTMVVGIARISVAPGRHMRSAVGLNRTGRHLLAVRRRLTVRLTATSAGQASAAVRSLSFTALSPRTR